MTKDVRCHYDVLSVARDADASTIKKAHRKLALRYHPDKNIGDETAAHEFRLVQQAYECLSDPAERKWYDEHRESILRGGKGFDGADGPDGGSGGSSFLFDVVPFVFSGCYDGYGDDEDGFFAVYSGVFDRIYEGERSGWVGEGNIDVNDMTNRHLSDVSFGTSSSGWADVSSFYSAWESFSSCLSFAWADQYDPRDAPNRRVRRAIDEENRKARKNAKRARNDEILNLVHFVKRRDPRVKEQKERAEQEQLAKEAERKKDAERRKAEAAIAREKWREEAEKAMVEAEANDLDAGRIRLADLDDDDEYYAKRGRKNKSKKGKKGKKNRWVSEGGDSDNANDGGTAEDGNVPTEDATPIASNASEGTNNPDSAGTGAGGPLDAPGEGSCHDIEQALGPNDEGAGSKMQTCAPIDSEKEYENSESSESDEEPDIWRCSCCRKDFKSEKQLENHLKSKKHREAWKKYENKLKREEKEAAVMDDLLDEMHTEGQDREYHGK